jgi:hypothetical protein
MGIKRKSRKVKVDHLGIVQTDGSVKRRPPTSRFAPYVTCPGCRTYHVQGTPCVGCNPEFYQKED